MAHSRGVADRGFMVVLSARKASAKPSSDKISKRPIFLPHLRHFPFKTSQEIIGILSNHFNLVLHERQTEREPRFLAFLVSFKRKRRA